MNPRRPWLPHLAQLLPDDPTQLPGGGGGNPAPTPPVPGPPPERTLSQSEVNALLTREADRAQRTYRDQLLAQHGVQSVDDLATLLATGKAARDAQLTDQQKATQAADEARAAADKERAEAAAERVSFRKQGALLQAGMPLQVPSPDGKTMVDNPQLAYALRLIDVDPGADPGAVSAAVAKLKTDLPSLFAAPAPAPTGNPGPPPRVPASGGTAGAAGKARAAAYAAQRPGAPRPTV